LLERFSSLRLRQLDRDSASVSAGEQPLRCQKVKISPRSVHGNLEVICDFPDRHLIANAKEVQKLTVPFDRECGTNRIGARILFLRIERVHGKLK
jgi:hypothetical protein